MRIKLKEGKQKELILLAKGNLTWGELSLKLNCPEKYLCNDLKSERRLLSEKLYNNLCKLANSNFNSYILERLNDDWGRSKGGKKSSKNTKKIIAPEKSKKLAEIFGIILGDGHVSEIKIGSKIRVYWVRVAGNSKEDKEYIFCYIPKIFEEVFLEKGSISRLPDRNVGYFTIYGKNVIEFFKINGLKPGNKIKNNQGIPLWIKENNEFLKSFIRELIDTDGSIHKISKNNKNIRIDFTSYIPNLLKEVRESLIKLGFNPSKIINNKHFFLSRQSEIEKYIQEIGFGNSKNLNRYKVLKESPRQDALVV